jgi:subtilisin-like proprotein convertase family protein
MLPRDTRVRRSSRPARLAVLLGVGAAFAAAPAAQATPTTFHYGGAAVAIPDAADLTGTAPGAVANAPIAVSGLPAMTADVDFRIDGTSCSNASGSTTVGIDHTFVNDLKITLTSPGGTSVLVIDNTDGSGNNLCQVILDDDAAAPSIQTAVTAQAPFSGTWLPNSPLSAFDGEDPNGTWTVSAQDFYSGDTGSIRAVSIVVDAKSATTTTATSSSDVALGAAVTDAATVSGRVIAARQAASGADTVDFRLFGPDDATCAAAPAFESLGRPVDASGHASSEPFTPPARGTYRWVAAYGGDADSAASSTACDAAGQTVVVRAATTTAGSRSVPAADLGTALSGAAVVVGREAAAAGDTVDFRLYGPGDGTCAGTAAFQSLGRPVDAGGAASSEPFTPTVPGTYVWMATYGGDANNAASSTACQAPGQATIVRAAAPAGAAPPPSAAPAPAAAAAPRSCRSKRQITVRLIPRRGLLRDLRGARLVGATLTGAGGRAIAQRVRPTVATIDLRGLPRGRFTVRVRVRLRGGRTITFVNRYRTCEVVASTVRIAGDR